mgnify:CR=1 FL=1
MKWPNFQIRIKMMNKMTFWSYTDNLSFDLSKVASVFLFIITDIPEIFLSNFPAFFSIEINGRS